MTDLFEINPEKICSGKPDNCTCDPYTWVDPDEVPPICDNCEIFNEKFCERCGHDRTCHEKD